MTLNLRCTGSCCVTVSSTLVAWPFTLRLGSCTAAGRRQAGRGGMVHFLVQCFCAGVAEKVCTQPAAGAGQHCPTTPGPAPGVQCSPCPPVEARRQAARKCPKAREAAAARTCG